MKPRPFVTRFVILTGAAIFCAGALNQCQTIAPPPTVERAAAETKMQQQLDQLRGEITALKGQQHDAAMTMKQQAASAGAALHGATVAAELLRDPETKQAVISETSRAKVAVEQIAPADPKESAAAETRVVDLVSQKLAVSEKNLADSALQLATAQTALEKAEAALATKTAEAEQKNADLHTLRDRLEDQSKLVAGLKDQLATERRDRAAAASRSAQEAAREREQFVRWHWVNTTRFGGFAIVVCALLVIALTRGEALAQGVFLAVMGMAVTALGWNFDVLWHAHLFPYVLELVLAAVLGGLGWAVFFFWQTEQLYRATTAALQDLKDESEAKRSELWVEVREHLKYRLGLDQSYWARVLHGRLINRGLRSANRPAANSTPACPAD